MICIVSSNLRNKAWEILRGKLETEETEDYPRNEQDKNKLKIT